MQTHRGLHQVSIEQSPDTMPMLVPLPWWLRWSVPMLVPLVHRWLRWSVVVVHRWQPVPMAVSVAASVVGPPVSVAAVQGLSRGASSVPAAEELSRGYCR